MLYNNYRNGVGLHLTMDITGGWISLASTFSMQWWCLSLGATINWRRQIWTSGRCIPTSRYDKCSLTSCVNVQWFSQGLNRSIHFAIGYYCGQRFSSWTKTGSPRCHCKLWYNIYVRRFVIYIIKKYYYMILFQKYQFLI